jgi:hypothetical protein
MLQYSHEERGDYNRLSIAVTDVSGEKKLMAVAVNSPSRFEEIAVGSVDVSF